MFALTLGEGMCLGFPDVCITPIPSPAGPIPTPLPYPNTSESATCPDPAVNVLAECMPVINQMSSIAVSEGDDTGVEGGIVSHDISGETVFILGSLTVMADGLPIQRLTSITGQNAMGVLPNAPGACLVPSQFVMLVLG